MMRGAVDALREAVPQKQRRPKLLAVTIVTSLDTEAMHAVGIPGAIKERAVHLARLARQSGLDGVVTSAHEARAIRSACGRRFIILVPGVRPNLDGKRDDQARGATPAQAIRAGADYIVVGRPITAAQDPYAAAQAILEEIRRASSRRV